MAAPQRIVSLTPSGTEILCALGLEHRLVGISPACDYPPTVLSLPRLTPQDARLRTLQPDLILTPSLETLSASDGTEVLALQPLFLQDIWDDIHRVGAVTGQQRQAATLLEALFARVNALVAETIMLHEPPRVAVLVGLAPLQLAGYWLPDMIQLAGGAAGLSRPGEPPVTVAWEQLRTYAPEVLVLSPQGLSCTDGHAALALLQGLAGWEALPVVPQAQVYAIDASAAFYRPGPRVVDHLELLAGLIHPDLFGEHLPPDGDGYRHLTA